MLAPVIMVTAPVVRAQEPGAAGGAGTEKCQPSEVRLEFGVNSATLGSASRKSLDEVVQWLEQDNRRSVKLEGFTDPSGPSGYNDELSYRRADAAKRHLLMSGVAPARVHAAGEGEMSPAESPLASQQRAVLVMYCEAIPTSTPIGTTGEAAPSPTQPPAAAEATPPAAPAEPSPPLAQAEPPAEALPEVPPAEPEPPPMAVTPPMTETTQAPPPRSGLAAVGVGFSVGGGVGGFTDEQARALTGTAGGWDVRLAFGTRLPVAMEAAYVGSAQSIDALGLDDDTVLIGNGIEGALRLQIPNRYVTPYALVGLGWTRYSLTNQDTNRSTLINDDDVLTMPLGLGLTVWSVFGGTFDLRGVIRPTWYDSLMDGFYSGTGATAGLHTWNVSGNLGWNF